MDTMLTLPDDLPGFQSGNHGLITTRFLGRLDDGDRVHVTVELRETTAAAPYQTITHTSITDLVELSVTGTLTRKHSSHPYGFGQCHDAAADIVRPADGVTVADCKRFAELAKRWHLNAMRAACAHQTVVWEDSNYGRRPSLTLTEPCPITGYKYGHAWLAEALPVDVVAELADIVNRAPRHH